MTPGSTSSWTPPTGRATKKDQVDDEEEAEEAQDNDDEDDDFVRELTDLRLKVSRLEKEREEFESQAAALEAHMGEEDDEYEGKRPIWSASGSSSEGAERDDDADYGPAPPMGAHSHGSPHRRRGSSRRREDDYDASGPTPAEVETLRRDLAGVTRVALRNESQCRAAEHKTGRLERKVRLLERELRRVKEALTSSNEPLRSNVEAANVRRRALPSAGTSGGLNRSRNEDFNFQDVLPSPRRRRSADRALRTEMFLRSAADRIDPPLPQLARHQSGSSSSSTTVGGASGGTGVGVARRFRRGAEQTNPAGPPHSRKRGTPATAAPPGVPFILGTSTGPSLNAHARSNSGSRRCIETGLDRRLRREISVLNDEYRTLLRDGAALSEAGLERLDALVSLIEDKERSLRLLWREP